MQLSFCFASPARGSTRRSDHIPRLHCCPITAATARIGETSHKTKVLSSPGELGSRCGASHVTLVTRRRGGVPRARRILRRYLPAEILTYLIINFLWAGLSLWLVSTLVINTVKPKLLSVF